MALWQYKAVDPRGRMHRGQLEARNVDELELRLAHLDLLLVRLYDEDGTVGRLRRALWQRETVSRKTLILFCIHLGQLLHAGVAIPVALEEMRSSIPQPRLGTALAAMVEDIHSGKCFSDAVQGQPHLFPPLFASLIQVGERTGKLEEIVADLAETLKWEEALLAQTRKALRYPLLVGVMVLALFFFLMTYLAPRLVSFLPQMGVALPWHTQALLALSGLVIHGWPLLVLTPLLAYGGVRLACRCSPRFQVQWDRWRWRIWYFGPLVRQVHLVRLVNALALMYRSGVSILDALASLAPLSGNQAMQQSIEQAQRLIAEGNAVSASFQQTGLLSTPLPRLLQSGEEAGQLDVALLNVGYFLNQAVQERIGQLQSLLEPVLTLVVGSLLIWVILSVLGPIYDVVTHVQF
ncbi:MAG: type II secretion system F family protein [Magnetococcales bacterium]|nr:type II secretion system F family protein [Magnetococcales bacterium]